MSFKRARNKPKLGPDGGDGGFGGDITLVANRQLNTLSHLRYHTHHVAEDGSKGGVNNRTGRDGKSIEIKVPLGTQIFRDGSTELYGEILKNDDRILVAEGGKRGMGNSRFLTSTHQAPEEHTPGGPSQSAELRLELKLIADIGLAGFPNAGKSTLLSVISAARPKIADYPFTTLEPQLGVVDHPDEDPSFGKSMVVADIPGLIEGASIGKGLGIQFLKHIERTRAIAYVIDISSHESIEGIIKNYEVLKKELGNFGDLLIHKEAFVILTKWDALEDKTFVDQSIDAFSALGLDALCISSVAQIGLKELKRKLFEYRVDLSEGMTETRDERLDFDPKSSYEVFRSSRKVPSELASYFYGNTVS